MLGRSCKDAQQARKLYRMCRERAAGYYTELAWALGEMIVEIPYLLIQASLYSVITYFMIWFEINAGASATLYHPFAAHHAVLREACAQS